MTANITMIEQTISYENLSRVFSKARLSSYIKATEGEELKALELYKINMHLSKVLYPLFCVFEITLRNRIVNVLVERFGNGWFIEKDKLWLNGKFPAYRNENEKFIELIKIEEAKKNLRDKKNNKIIITSNEIIPELNFAFWTYILHKRYDEILWRSDISKVFPNTPQNYSFDRKLKELRKQINEIRDMRNRVYHYEPVFCRRTKSFNKLKQLHDDTITIIQYLSEEAFIFINENDEIKTLITQGEIILNNI